MFDLLSGLGCCLSMCGTPFGCLACILQSGSDIHVGGAGLEGVESVDGAKDRVELLEDHLEPVFP